VNSPFAAFFEFEMFDGVRDEDLGPIDARFGQPSVEQLPGWPNEWKAVSILLVARLFSD
jgi:hypothetical protein